MPANLNSVSTATNIPIGGIIPWAKSLSGIGTLPSGWQECDGSAISNLQSPLNGQNSPNLNGASGVTKRFLRGSSTSGTTGDGANGLSCGRYGGAAEGSLISVGTSNTPDAILPSFYEVVFIIRIF